MSRTHPKTEVIELTKPFAYTIFEERFAFCGQILMIGTWRVLDSWIN